VARRCALRWLATRVRLGSGGFPASPLECGGGGAVGACTAASALSRGAVRAPCEDAMDSWIRQRLSRVVNVGPGELRALLWAFAYFFSLMCAWYVLRPLRDEMGVAAGVANLQWLFTGTFFLMLLAVPAFGALVARLPRERFIPWVYRFFILSLVAFWALLQWGEGRITVARALFMWASVFNLFVVTVFWGFMADLFRYEQGRRLFGFIAAGGTAGALLGPTLTALLAHPLGPVNLLLVSAAILEGATRCAKALLREPPTDSLAVPSAGEPPVADPEGAGGPPAPASSGPAGVSVPDGAVPAGTSAAATRAGSGAGGADGPLGGGMLAGLVEVARSPYLMMICGHVLLLSLVNTFLYFQQAQIVAGAFDSPAERTRVFALIDLSVGLAALAIQLLVTGRVMLRFGVGVSLALLAVVTMSGFAALALIPALAVLIAFQAIKRAAEFALANPARETLFTVVTREQKYKSKSFIDTAVFRGGDAASGWLYTGLRQLGLDASAIAWIAVPVSGLWAVLLLRLGAAQQRLADAAAARSS